MTRKNQRIDFDPMTTATHTRHMMLCFVLAAEICFMGGCRSLLGTKEAIKPETTLPQAPASQVDRVADDEVSPIAQVSGESPLAAEPTLTAQAANTSVNDKVTETTKQVLNLVTGREQENSSRAKELYIEADAIFRKASSLEVRSYRAV